MTRSSVGSLSNIPHCWRMPKPCLSFSVAVNTLITTKDRRLGKPLPHQQANPMQAYFKATVSLF